MKAAFIMSSLIQKYDSDEELTNMFRHINGILFPGGGTSLKNVSTNRFYAAASLLYSLANEENKRHPWSFPIQGTCLGFQLLSVLAAGDEVLCGGCFEGTDGDPLPLTFTSDLSRSWLFESMTKTLVDKLRVENLTENSHSSGVEPSAFAKSEKLAEMYTVLSVNFDENGREFVSTFEGKKLPYSATQWHPEKNNFEFGGVGALGKRAIPHTADAVAVSQYFANNFVNRARRSLQNFSTSEAEASALIYNDAKYLVTDPAGYFDQLHKAKKVTVTAPKSKPLSAVKLRPRATRSKVQVISSGTREMLPHHRMDDIWSTKKERGATLPLLQSSDRDRIVVSEQHHRQALATKDDFASKMDRVWASVVPISVDAILGKANETSATRDLDRRDASKRRPHEETGNEIGGDALSVHAVGFVYVGNATDASRLYPMPCPAQALREGGCWVADPLLHLDPMKNETRLVENATVALWITIDVPPGTAAGSNYTGNVVVHVEGATQPVVVRADVRVFGFDLPVAPRLKNAIQLDIAHLFRSFEGRSMDEIRRIYLRTAEWLLSEYRINPGSIYDSWSNLTASTLSAYKSPFVANVSDLVRWKRLGLNYFTLPYAPPNETRAFVEELRKTDDELLSMSSFYGFDEFSGPFSEIADAFTSLRASFPEVQTMTTAHIGTQYGPLVKEPLPFEPAALEQIGVTAIVPSTNYLPPTENVTTVQKAGKEVWTYISLQPYKPLACWRLDNPTIDVRGLFWQIFELGFDGILYWGVNQWSGFNRGVPIPTLASDSTDAIFRDLPFVSRDAWDVATYHDGTLPWLFGDGKMLYAGTTPSGDTDTPIGSVRLANIRDGLDDFDYLSLLRETDAELALKIASEVGGGSIASLVRNATTLRNARSQIGSALEKRDDVPLHSKAMSAFPELNLQSGKVRGVYEHNRSVAKYLGIPFAEPPIGALRWQPPKLVQPWGDNVRDAFTYSKSCIQRTDAAWTILSGSSEDCLYLNVWTPSTPTDGGNAAMVFFYGGSWAEGSAMFPLYNGEPLVELSREVVVVIANYRLNVFGFLGGDELRGSDGSTGNFGIQDQRLVLEWVRDNAEGLGVNTSKITIFGESAGSGSVANHLVQKSSFGLYTRAIMESGPVEADWVAQDLTLANKRLAALKTNANCDGDLRECLLGLNTSEVYALGRSIPKMTGALCDWTPVIDGVELLAHPRDLLARGAYNRGVPIMLGTNADEGALLSGNPNNADESTYAAWLSKTFDNFDISANISSRILEEYPCKDFNATKYGTSCFWAGSAAFGDYAMRCPAAKTARMVRDDPSGKGASVYLYHFERKLEANDLIEYATKKPYGVFHGSELALVFDFSELLLGERERDLAADVVRLWTHFAVHGDPSTSTITWPAFDTSEPYLAVDTPIRVSHESNATRSKCDFWNTIGPLRVPMYQ
eukprot:g1952.t1